MTSTLHVTFSRDLSNALCAEAEKRGVRPQVLVAGVASGVVRGGLFDAVLDGDDPRQLAGGHARGAVSGLTLIQEAVLYLIGLHAGRDGWCRYSAAKLAELSATATVGGVQGALGVLRANRLIARGEPLAPRSPVPFRLTPAGRALYARLSGTDGEGGEG